MLSQPFKLRDFNGKKGIYVLVFKLTSTVNITIGCLGNLTFKADSYLYVGSALGTSSNSLGHRITRHISSVKQFHWHIDYFLPFCELEVIHILLSSEPKECKIANQLAKTCPQPYQGFGSSDCKKKCLSHLFQGDSSDVVNAFHDLSFLKGEIGFIVEGIKAFLWRNSEIT